MLDSASLAVCAAVLIIAAVFHVCQLRRVANKRTKTFREYELPLEDGATSDAPSPSEGWFMAPAVFRSHGQPGF